MKKQIKNFIAILLLCFAFFTCEEESRGPLVEDDTFPAAVTNVTVENLPGGAKLTYQAPTDEDVLYVEAGFERNGNPVTTRASIHNDFIIIEGLNDTSTQEVTLVAVDRSDNHSDAITASITPQKAPIQCVYDTFSMEADFGGVRVRYKNEYNIRFELLLYTIENGQRTYQTSDFIADGQQAYTIFRGFDPVTVRFGVEAVDRWDNTTPLFEADILPFEEFVLDRTLTNKIELPQDEPTAFGFVLENLFDNNLGTGFHTAQGAPGAVIPPYAEAYHMFTMDLGQVAKLSRLKFWLRNGCCGTPFGHGDTRFYEIWGIDEIPADNGATFTGWTKLVENGEVIKPSGAPLGSHSAEDIALAVEGVEVELPLEAPPVRYIRFVNFENWSGTDFVHIMEFQYFGQPE